MKMAANITIKYCRPCGFARQAERLAEEIRGQYAGRIDSVEVLPTDEIGSFEVSLEGKLFFSKKSSGRLPFPGEIEQELLKRMVNK